MKNQAVLSSLFNFKSGYQVILDQLLSDDFKDVFTYKRAYSTVPKKYEHHFDNLPEFPHGATELFLTPAANELSASNPLCHIPDNKNRIIFTMWESSRIYDIFIDILNKQRSVIVPNNWNKENFIRQGVKVDIDVLPLFVDNSFCYKPPFKKNTFDFGCSNNDPRKRLKDVIHCFQKAFPSQKDVRLNLKLSERDSPIDSYMDNRISIIKKDLNDESLRQWYCGNDVYVSCVAAEGWGLMQHESMACGRPVIAARYAGLKELMTSQNSFPVDYLEVPSEGFWKSPCGKWSKYDENHMIKTMRYCYKNQKEVKNRGLLASKDACKFSKAFFKSQLLSILKK